MEDLNQRIERHYLKEGLYEDIVERLKDLGVDLENVKRSDLAAVDEFHVRGAAVSRELARSIDLHGLDILDVGCGVGGPSRMLAEEFDCHVTGIDLSHEYIRTARALTRLVKLDSRTRFVVGDAAALPFGDDSFEVVWTQHAQMNIPDKKKFYSGIKRVLKPGGYFLFYDIFKNQDREVQYPMPWASTADQSFLFTPKEMDSILAGLGFKKVSSTSQTQAGIEFFDALVAKMKASGPPKLGLNVTMGASTQTKLMNLLGQMKDGTLALESGVYQKG
ncbi:MAG: class I SAM-dependent methyltransferase [Bacteroidota bacterium]|nr:class I SAM-dependent methyltransferase [Bacteroidota bacterium]